MQSLDVGMAAADVCESANGGLPTASSGGVAGMHMRTCAKRKKPPRKNSDDVAIDHPRARANQEPPVVGTPIPSDVANTITRESAKATKPVVREPLAVEVLARRRAVWLDARNRLYLHALALCRSLCDGDKKEAVKVYKAHVDGTDFRLAMMIEPFIDDIARWDARIKPLEKLIAAEMAKLPIATRIDSIRGIGALNMAAVIAKTGSFAQYRSVAALWRKLGLGVAADGLTREAPITPGKTNKSKHLATCRVLADGMIRAGDPVFREIYDREKAKATNKGWTKARSHAHALRYGVKYVIRRLYKDWRNAENFQ